jgi:hypothetical protein
MIHKKSYLTVSTLAMLMVIQSSDLRVLPSEASASSLLDQSQSKAHRSRQTNARPKARPPIAIVPARPPIAIVPDFSLEISDVKYMGFNVNPSNSELGLRRDEGLHWMKVFWKQFSGCFSYFEDVQLVAKLILRDGTERVFHGKLNPAQDCKDANCFSTVALPGLSGDGHPARYEVQITDGATFHSGSSDKKTIGHFPQAPREEIDIPPGAIVGTPRTLSGPGSIDQAVKITDVEYAGLAGSIHALKVYYTFSNFTCFNQRPQIISSPLDVWLFVKDKQSGANHTISNNGGVNYYNDCSSTGDCLSTVRVTGKATDDRPTAIFVYIQSIVIVNARGVGIKKGEF